VAAVCAPLVGPEPIPVADQVNMLPSVRAMLLPSAQRHASLEVRRLCVEIIHLLVVNRTERTYLRQIQIYPLLRELHKAETDETMQAYIEEVVQFFILDEAPENGEAPSAADASLPSARVGLPTVPESSAVGIGAARDRDEDGEEVPDLLPPANPLGIESGGYVKPPMVAMPKSGPPSHINAVYRPPAVAVDGAGEAEAGDAAIHNLLDD
jgi:hypothetical protein